MVVVIAIGVLLGHSRRHLGAPGAGGSKPSGGEAMLTGAVEACDGPTPGSCRVTNVGICAPTCFTTRYVLVRSMSGAAVERVALRRGRFSTTLAPGAYDLDLIAAAAGGRTRMLSRKPVTVAHGATLQVAFKLAIR